MQTSLYGSSFRVCEDTFLSSLMSSLLSSNKERLDLPSTCSLFEGLPGVLPSTIEIIKEAAS